MIINNFSEILGRKKLKITTVSKETGITRPTLTSLYYGSSKGISFDVLNKLCDFLDISPSDLFTFYPVDIDKINIKIKPGNGSDWAFLVTGEITFIQKNLDSVLFTGGFVQCEKGGSEYDVSLAMEEAISKIPAGVKDNIEKTLFDEIQTAFLNNNPDAVIGGCFFNYYD